MTFKFLPQIPTNELVLLLKFAESTGYGEAAHAKAYRAELAARQTVAKTESN